MIQQYLSVPVVAVLASSLTSALLKQEQFYLANYTNATHHPEYLALTRVVNNASQKLAEALSGLDNAIAFTHKVTLVDDSMDINLLAENVVAHFGGKVAIESKNSSQLVVYTNADNASDVKTRLYKANKQMGMISCFNIAQRTHRPYIVGLNTWQDARQIKEFLLNPSFQIAS